MAAAIDKVIEKEQILNVNIKDAVPRSGNTFSYLFVRKLCSIKERM